MSPHVATLWWIDSDELLYIHTQLQTGEVNMFMHTIHVSICGALTMLPQIMNNLCGKL